MGMDWDWRSAKSMDILGRYHCVGGSGGACVVRSPTAAAHRCGIISAVFFPQAFFVDFADAGLFDGFDKLYAGKIQLKLYHTDGRPPSAFRTAGVNAIVGGLCLGSGFACWIFALTHTTVANALFLLSASPFLSAILARIVIGERVARATWLAMTVALLGVAVMVGEGMVVGTLFGNVMGLTAALAFSGFTVALRRGKSVDMLPTVCLAGTFASIIAGTVILATGSGFVVSGYDLSLCATLGIGQIGCGLILFTIGSRYVPAAELALLSLTEVVLGPLWVWISGANGAARGCVVSTCSNISSAVANKCPLSAWFIV